MLCANAEAGLQIQSPLKGLQGKVNGTKPGPRSRQAVMDVSCFGFSFNGALEHFLSGNILATV
jgi:hypothetical protein